MLKLESLLKFWIFSHGLRGGYRFRARLVQLVGHSPQLAQCYSIIRQLHFKGGPVPQNCDSFINCKFVQIECSNNGVGRGEKWK